MLPPYFFTAFERLVEAGIILNKSEWIRNLILDKFESYGILPTQKSANRDFTTSPPLSKRNPSKKLDKDGIDYIPVCGDCCHWLSQRNYCLKRKWDAYANSEGCESFAYTDEDTQGSMIEKGGAEE